MTEIAAYGLPTRARHWSYGKVYQSQRLYGTMGLSKIYEIVLNSDPCLAFLLDTNPEIANLLVAVHVFGHGDFFKHNVLFAATNRHMINDAVEHALRIDGYIERYGLETVEHLMDIGFALDRSRDRDAILEALLAPRYNYGMPRIVAQDVVNNTLYLEHLDRTSTFLDRRFATQTLAYIAELWRHPVHLLTGDEQGKEVSLTAQAS